MLSGGTPQSDPTINLYSTSFITSNSGTLGTIPIQFTGKAGYTGAVAIDTGNQFTSKNYTDTTFYPKTTRLNGISSADGNVTLNNNKITLLGNPTAATDAANKTYVDSSAGSVRDDIYWDVTGALIERGFTESLHAGTDFGYMKGLLNEIDARNTSVNTTLSSLATTNTTQNNRLTAIETKNAEQDTAVAFLDDTATSLSTRLYTLENADVGGITQAQLNAVIYAS